jgi:hypothetical protein|tara:strand:- start:121 stop:348 length:228 start_codon:yes stop_codon:yes gene_type:complete
MKKLLIALCISAFALGCSAADDKKAPEVKTVCLDVQGKDGKPVMDKKTGKPKQNCTKVKVRKKFDGTKVPDGKKK